MRVEEIALRQEIRQMLSEVGLNKNTMYEMAKEVLSEEIEKQVKNALNQNNVNCILRSKISSYELRELLREAIKEEIKDSIKVSVTVETERNETEL